MKIKRDIYLILITFLLVSLLLISIAPTSTSVNPASIDDGLVGYWKMNELLWEGIEGEVKDSSSSKNHGTADSGATTAAEGQYGRAGEFDGIDDSVSIGNPTSLQLDKLSISVWFKPADNTDSIITKGKARGAAADRDWDLLGNGESLVFVLSHGIGYGGLGDVRAPYPSLNVWHHAVATWDGTSNANGLKLYIDGELAGQADASATNNSNDEPIYIGGGEQGIYQFKGLIDEVQIYNRAIDPDEVTYLFEGEEEEEDDGFLCFTSILLLVVGSGILLIATTIKLKNRKN